MSLTDDYTDRPVPQDWRWVWRQDERQPDGQERD